MFAQINIVKSLFQQIFNLNTYLKWNLIPCFSWLLVFSGLVFGASCGKDDPIEVISGFSYKADAADFLTIKFTNPRMQLLIPGILVTTLPIQPRKALLIEYAAVGSYTVKLTAETSDGGTGHFYPGSNCSRSRCRVDQAGRPYF